MRILGIFAHPDDETFCAGGTFAHYAALGAELMVVSFTQGEAGQIRDARTATRRTLGGIRAQELSAACQHLGVRHSLCLDYGDGKLMSLDPEILVEKATDLIRTFRPDVVITFGDDGAYGHPDHVAISRVTTEAFKLAGDGSQFPHQLKNGVRPHQPQTLYHASFPNNQRLLMQEIVKWLGGLDGRFQGDMDFAHGLMLFADESTMLGYASDSIAVEWYPSGFYIIEQGEPASSLYLILSGRARVIKEDTGGSLEEVAELRPGEFVGEMGLMGENKTRSAHVIADDNVTCLVFSPAAPSDFAGRGETADHHFVETDGLDGADLATTRIDIRPYINHKIAAISAHRSQYPITQDMFPEDMMRELIGFEYFNRIFPAQGMETGLNFGKGESNETTS